MEVGKGGGEGGLPPSLYRKATANLISDSKFPHLAALQDRNRPFRIITFQREGGGKRGHRPFEDGPVLC